MPTKSPLISIIVPVYNAQQYLSQCVESIRKQTYHNIEIILVNDGSTDRSAYICDQYGITDDRIVVIHIENNGVANARNVGIDASNGEFIMFVDSDDWIDELTCEETVKLAVSQSLDVTFFSWYKFDNKNRYKENFIENNSAKIYTNDIEWVKVRTIGPIGDELRFPTKTDIYNTPWAKLYKACIIKENNIRFIKREKVGMEDVLFNIFLFQHVNDIGYLPSYLYNYRIDNDSSLTKNDIENLDLKLKNLYSCISGLGLNMLQLEALTNRIALNLINIFLSISSPRVQGSKIDKIKMVNSTLNDPTFSNALNKLKIGCLPVSWKIFFIFCKMKFASGVFVLTILMRKFR